MRAPTSKIAATAAILAVSNALKPAQPARTAPVEVALYGFTPKPTDPPSPDLVARRKALYARDSSTVTILYNANNTCGYVSGSRDLPFACANTDHYCALYTAHDNIPGRIACCDTLECHFQVTCIDYDQYYSSDACDDTCRSDTLTGKCTNSKYPHCNTVSFPGGVLDFACGVNSVVENQLLSSTYRGQTSGGTYLPLVITATDSSSLPAPTPTTSSPFPNDNSDKSGSNSDSDSGSDSEEDGEKKKKKSTPVGAIVGGVVGGVGAIGVAALAFVLFRRHKKKKQEKSQQSPSMPPPAQPMQQHGSPPPPGSMGPDQHHHSQYYDPAKFTGQTYSSTSPSYGGTSPYQPSTPGYYPSMHSPDTSTPQQGMVDPRTGQPSINPSLSYAQKNSSSPPPQMVQQQPQQYQPSTSPQQIHNAYNAPPQEARGPPGAPAGVVHEAPTDISDQHRGQMHELA